jgi:hypothetical protein
LPCVDDLESSSEKLPRNSAGVQETSFIEWARTEAEATDRRPKRASVILDAQLKWCN